MLFLLHVTGHTFVFWLYNDENMGDFNLTQASVSHIKAQYEHKT